jgi:hypothetical protein
MKPNPTTATQHPVPAPAWTPGPWEVLTYRGGARIAVKTDDALTDICDLSPYAKDHDANARLIAAAPELAKAVENLLLIIDGLRAHVRPDDREESMMASARAILARIQGNGEGGGV